MATTTKTQDQFGLRVVGRDRWEPDLSRRIADIDLRSPLAHPFQMELFAALFNTDPARPHFAVVAEDGDGVAAYWWGYFARYRERPRPRSTAWVRSGPVIRADLVDRRDHLLSLMLAELKRHVRQQGVGWLIFTTETLYGAVSEGASRAQGFHRYDLQTYLLDLTPPEEELWTRLDGRVRWGVNKGRKNGVVVEHAASDEDILSYYRLFLEKGSVPAYRPPSEQIFLPGFQRLREEDRARIIVAKHDGRVVAGGFFLCHAGLVAHHQQAVSAEGRRLRAGNLLFWESVLFFKSAGLSTLDMVSVEVAPPEGSREAGVRHFKSRWGGELLDTPVYQYLSPGLRVWRAIAGKLRLRRRSTPRLRAESVAQEGG
jgi:hypothetical protein